MNERLDDVGVNQVNRKRPTRWREMKTWPIKQSLNSLFVSASNWNVAHWR